MTHFQISNCTFHYIIAYKLRLSALTKQRKLLQNIPHRTRNMCVCGVEWMTVCRSNQIDNLSAWSSFTENYQMNIQFLIHFNELSFDYAEFNRRTAISNFDIISQEHSILISYYILFGCIAYSKNNTPFLLFSIHSEAHRER